ncbi:pilus assembly protein [Cellulomonas soli]
MSPARVVGAWRRRVAVAVQASRGPEGEQGSAVLEFLALSVVLLIPLMYLVLVLGRVQAATFAAEGAARTAARAYVVASTPTDGAARAVASVGLALQDQGFDDDPDGALTLTCTSVPCLEPGSEVAARVDVRVPLPFVPSFVRDVVPLEVPVSAERTAPVDVFRAAP